LAQVSASVLARAQSIAPGGGVSRALSAIASFR